MTKQLDTSAVKDPGEFVRGTYRTSVIRRERIKQLTKAHEQTCTDVLHHLDLAAELHAAYQLEMSAYVAAARYAGHSWTKIGAALGMTKQAAQQKYGAKPSTTVDDPDQMKITDVD